VRRADFESQQARFAALGRDRLAGPGVGRPRRHDQEGRVAPHHEEAVVTGIRGGGSVERVAGTVSIAEFFAPENLTRIMGAPVPA